MICLYTNIYILQPNLYKVVGKMKPGWKHVLNPWSNVCHKIWGQVACCPKFGRLVEGHPMLWALLWEYMWPHTYSVPWVGLKGHHFGPPLYRAFHCTLTGVLYHPDITSMNANALTEEMDVCGGKQEPKHPKRTYLHMKRRSKGWILDVPILDLKWHHIFEFIYPFWISIQNAIKCRWWFLKKV